jgi:microsomal epoxide hydrolase
VNFCIMPRPESISLESLANTERANAERGFDCVATRTHMQGSKSSGNDWPDLKHKSSGNAGMVIIPDCMCLCCVNCSRVGGKFLEWTDETPPLKDILASVSLYWLTDTFSRASYPYREVTSCFPSLSADL